MIFRKNTNSTELMRLPNTLVHAPDTEKQKAAPNIYKMPFLEFSLKSFL
jgi:hypothetical protein